MQGRGGRQEMSGQWAALNKMDLPPFLDTPTRTILRYCYYSLPGTTRNVTTRRSLSCSLLLNLAVSRSMYCIYFTFYLQLLCKCASHPFMLSNLKSARVLSYSYHAKRNFSRR